MKAAVYLGPEKIEIKEVETPVPKEKEVLIKVKSCAVCGTDVRIFTYGQKNVIPPHIIGHEIAGVIDKLGKDTKTDLKPGDKVTVVTSVGCQQCKYCKNGYYNLCDNPRYIGYYYSGGYAEYMIVPEEAVVGNNILKVDPNLSFPEISIIEPLSCCINGQEYLNIQEGDIVVIFGAGPIGCMHAELAKVSGAEKIIMIDVSEQRLQLASRFHITDFVNSKNEDPVKKVLQLTDNQGADVIITACSVNTVQEQSLNMVSKKGRISFFAGISKENPYIKFDSNIIHYKEVSVYGAFASYRKQYEKAHELIATGKIDAKKFITHKFPLDKIIDGINTTKSGIGLKSVIEI